ncbi:CRAL-TRIO domain-containing protein [Globomyces pollinis-pini]|nr:CRAL-TRIO domain-containing protein [Globomyces pollinis-pini]
MVKKTEQEFIDPDDVLTGVDEAERAIQINNFVVTARELYRQDGIDAFQDHEIAKWLLGKGGHRGKGLEALSETLSWRQSYKVDQILTEDFTVFEKSGKLQWYGVAVDGSVVACWNGSRHVAPKTQQERDLEMRYIVYFIEKGRKDGILKDKLTIVFDRNGMKTDKSDGQLASYIIPVLQKHYPERLSKMYLFPTNTIFWMAWNMSSYFLDPVTIPKINLKDSPVSLVEWIKRENYFKKYGGLAIDPFDTVQSDIKSTDNNNPTVIKSAQAMDLVSKPSELRLIEVEEVWSAPIEYQDC